MNCSVNDRNTVEINLKEGTIKLTNFNSDQPFLMYAAVYVNVETRVKVPGGDKILKETSRSVCNIDLSNLKKSMKTILGLKNVSNLKKLISGFRLKDTGYIPFSSVQALKEKIELLAEEKDEKKVKKKKK